MARQRLRAVAAADAVDADVENDRRKRKRRKRRRRKKEGQKRDGKALDWSLWQSDEEGCESRFERCVNREKKEGVAREIPLHCWRCCWHCCCCCCGQRCQIFGVNETALRWVQSLRRTKRRKRKKRRIYWMCCWKEWVEEGAKDASLESEKTFVWKLETFHPDCR